MFSARSQPFFWAMMRNSPILLLRASRALFAAIRKASAQSSSAYGQTLIEPLADSLPYGLMVAQWSCRQAFTKAPNGVFGSFSYSLAATCSL